MSSIAKGAGEKWTNDRKEAAVTALLGALGEACGRPFAADADFAAATGLHAHGRASRNLVPFERRLGGTLKREITPSANIQYRQ